MFLAKWHSLHWRSLVRGSFYTISMALTLLHGATVAAAQAEEVSVSNFTPYGNVPEFVRERLSEELKSLVKEKQLTVFVLADVYEGRKACFAMVGLSYRAPKKLNPRLPTSRYFAYSKAGEGDSWSAPECVGGSLQVAIEQLNKATPDKVLNGLEATAEDVGRVNGEAKRDRVSMSSFNLSAAASEAVFEKLHDHEVGALLDYRLVQASVFATSTVFNGGDIMCTVHAGIGAQTPEKRNMRWPGYTFSMVRVQTGGTPEGCVQTLAPATVDEMLKQPWSEKGIFHGIDKTREAGLPLPDIKSVAAKRAAVLNKRAAAERATKTQQARTVSRNELTCTNECFNGTCLRTFPNGRKERWQAPRVFNPMSKNWEWDITTNACGG